MAPRRDRSHGRGLRSETLLGLACRQRDLAIGLPTSKLATLNWFSDTTLGVDRGLVSADELYASMDWLLAQQSCIE